MLPIGVPSQGIAQSVAIEIGVPWQHRQCVLAQVGADAQKEANAELIGYANQPLGKPAAYGY